MFKLFRRIALIEGITTILLFFIAMPVKYIGGNPVLVPPVGMIHGVAFLVYIAAMFAAFRGRDIKPNEWVRTTLAAFIPLGTFVNDPFLKRKEQELTQ